MDDQARVEKYAGWLVQNEDKKGTPEFDTVATAYKALRSGATSGAPDKYKLSEVPAAALANAPADALATAKGIGTAAVAELPKSLGAVPQYINDHINPLNVVKNVGGQVVDQVKQLANDYGSWDKTKTRLAEHPVGAALDAATVLPMIPKGLGVAGEAGSAIASKARALNKFKTQYPEVAQSVAQDLHNMHSTGEYDVGNLDTAKGAVTKAHYNNGEELKANRTLLNDYFDPKQATGSGDAALRLEAAKAFKSSTHQVADHPLASEIDAVNKLVGHTQQGYELVHGLKKHVELQNIRKNIQGGVSQYTDMLNPLQIGQGRFGLKGLPGLALAGAQYSNPLGLMGAMGQAGVVVGGKLVDAARGMPNGSNAMRYMKQNLDAPVANVGQGLEDVVATRAAEAQAAAAQKVAAAKALADSKLKPDLGINKMALNMAHDNAKSTTAAFNKPVVEPKASPPKFDLGISQMTIKMAHQKAKATTAMFEKESANANAATVKAAEEAAKPIKAVEAAVAKAPSKAVSSSQKITEASHDPTVTKDSSGKVVNHLVEWNKKIAKVTKAHAHATRSANHRPKHLHAAISHIIKTATKALTEAPNAKAKSGVHTFQKVREDILKSALSKTSSTAGHAYVLKALTPLVEIWRDGLDHMATSKVEPPQKSILKKTK